MKMINVNENLQKKGYIGRGCKLIFSDCLLGARHCIVISHHLWPDRYLNFTEEETKDQRHRITCQRSKVADVQSYLTPHPNTVPWSMLPCHFLCLTCKLPKAAISSYLFSNFIYLSLIYTADWSVIGTTCVQPQYILEIWKICTLFDSAISCVGNYTEEKK